MYSTRAPHAASLWRRVHTARADQSRPRPVMAHCGGLRVAVYDVTKQRSGVGGCAVRAARRCSPKHRQVVEEARGRGSCGRLRLCQSYVHMSILWRGEQ